MPSPHSESGLIHPIGSGPVASSPQGDDPSLYGGKPLPRDLMILAGTSAAEIGLAVNGILARDGLAAPLLALDTDWSTGRRTLSTPEGQTIGFHPFEFVPLGRDIVRSSIADHPNPAVRHRFLGAGGLLSGLSVHEQFALPGLGSHAFRALAALDYTLDSSWPRRIRRALRPWRTLSDQGQSQAVGDDWVRPLQGEDRAPLRLRVWIVASAAGSVGSTGIVLLPYAVQREAAALGIQVVLYGVLLDSSLYAGLTPRVEENAAATLADLETAFRTGLSWTLGDGSTLDAATPPYWRLFLTGDVEAAETSLLEDAAQPQGERGAQVPESVRQAAYRRVGATLALVMTSDALDRVEAAAANAHPRPWATLDAALADLPLPALRAAVAAERTARAFRAMAGSDAS